MPIYAYKCASCGHAKDVLRRMSDEPLTICPACGASAFEKQLTAAGFQLKGSGWYVTDFRGGNTASAPANPEAASASGSPASTEGAPSTASAAPSVAAPTPASAPASAPAAPAAKSTP